MYILNFSHPLTEEQLRQVATLIGLEPEALEVYDIPVHLDLAAPFEPQIAVLADACGFTPQEWQATPFLVNVPALSTAAAALLAELHGRCGYFPPVIRLMRDGDALPPRFVVTEVVNLQALRDRARDRARARRA